MNKQEFSEKLRAQLAPCEITEVSIGGGRLLLAASYNGHARYANVKFEKLDDLLLTDVVNNLKASFE